MNRSNGRQALDCANPLAVSDPSRARKSGRGLPQSKTLSRRPTVRGEFMVPMHAPLVTSGPVWDRAWAHAPAETPSDR